MNTIKNLLIIEFDKNRVYGLDVMRCLAILSVVAGHSLDLLPETSHKNIHYILQYIVPFPDGVSVFFVLSGFLIGGILIKVLEKERHSFKTLLGFWKRRWLRTLPNYFLILSIIIILSILLIKDFRIIDVLSYFIFSQNIVTPSPPFFTEAWSLSIEEWFYLLIPFIIFFGVGILKLTPKKSVFVTILIIIIFTIAFRYYRYVTIPITSEEEWGGLFRGQVITRLDNLMFGVLGAYVFFYYTRWWVKYKNQSLIAGLILIVFVKFITAFYLSGSVFYYCNVSFILEAMAILLTLPWLSQLKKGNGNIYTFITYTSLISYSLYLIHGVLILHLILARIPFLQTANIPIIITRYILYWILIYTCSALLYKYFEKPIMLIRSKLK